MKKIYILSWLASVLLLAGCNTQNAENSNLGIMTWAGENIVCKNLYTVWYNNNQTFSLKAKVVSDKVKNVLANNWWIVSYLNCEPWKKVKSNTLIAKIKPDWTDPNIKNLLNQKRALQTQIENLKNIIAFTKTNFSSQLNSLTIQKNNLETQIDILTQNLAKLKQQKKYWVWDIITQIHTLETQLQDLEKSKAKLEESKQADITKLKKSLDNTISSSKSFLSNIFLKIDEIFWITDKNKHKNDAYESYLSAKNTVLKEKIKNEFLKIYSKFPQDSDYDWWSKYLEKVHKLLVIVKQAVSDSVPSRALPKSVIDGWYNMFSQYDTNLINLKTNLDNLNQSLKTVRNNYDTQILNLQTQINATKNNIDNLQKNKLGSYTSSIDVQINQIQSQLDNAKSNLSNILSQIESLKSQENIQIKQLDSQLSNLNTNLKNIITNLSIQNIYAGVDWKVKLKKIAEWNKVWPNSLLCQIIPDKSSLKFQVYTNTLLDTQNWYVYFDVNWKEYKVKVISKLPYKDPVSQNNIYETDTKWEVEFQDWKKQFVDLQDILQEWDILDVQYKNEWWEISLQKANQKIFIPLDYVVNKLTGYFVKKQINWNKIDIVKVQLWNVDWANVEILSWLKVGDVICK